MPPLLVSSTFEQARPSKTGSLSSGFSGIEQTQMTFFAVRFDPSSPFPALLMKRNPTVPRCCTKVRRDVVHVHPLADNSEIAATVIQRVAIDVVSNKTAGTMRQTEQLTMQVDRVLPLITRVVPSHGSFGDHPSPLVDPLSIGRIDDRVGANLSGAVAQRDPSGQTIFADDGINPRLPRLASLSVSDSGVLAQPRTVLRLPHLSDRGNTEVRRSASQAGTLNGHRPSPLGGVTPRAVSSSAGVSCCVNYSSQSC